MLRGIAISVKKAETPPQMERERGAGILMEENSQCRRREIPWKFEYSTEAFSATSVQMAQILMLLCLSLFRKRKEVSSLLSLSRCIRVFARPRLS